MQSRRAEGRPGSLRILSVYAGALLGGVALAAVVVLPFLELLLGSADLRQRAGSARDSFTGPHYLLGVFLPDYWGRATGTPLEIFLLARAFYAGALPLMLGAAALIIRPTRERIAIAGFGAVCMAVVVAAPPIFQIVTALPVFSSGHNTRLVVLAMLCLALLAGWGLDELTARRAEPTPRSRLVNASAVALFLAPLVFVTLGGRVTTDHLGDAVAVAFTLTPPPDSVEPFAGNVIRMASVLQWLVLGAAALAIFLARRRGLLPAVAFVALALAFTSFDLLRAGMGYVPAVAREYASQPATGAVRYLQGRRPARFVSTGAIPRT